MASLEINIRPFATPKTQDLWTSSQVWAYFRLGIVLYSFFHKTYYQYLGPSMNLRYSPCAFAFKYSRKIPTNNWLVPLLLSSTVVRLLRDLGGLTHCSQLMLSREAEMKSDISSERSVCCLCISETFILHLFSLVCKTQRWEHQGSQSAAQCWEELLQLSFHKAQKYSATCNKKKQLKSCLNSRRLSFMMAWTLENISPLSDKSWPFY